MHAIADMHRKTSCPKGQNAFAGHHPPQQVYCASAQCLALSASQAEGPLRPATMVSHCWTLCSLLAGCRNSRHPLRLPPCKRLSAACRIMTQLRALYMPLLLVGANAGLKVLTSTLAMEAAE